MLRDYHSAVSLYRLAKDDFHADKAALHYARYMASRGGGITWCPPLLSFLFPPAVRVRCTPWPPSSLAHLSRSPVCARDVTHSRVHACVWCTTMSRFVAGGAAVCFFGRVMVDRTDCRRGRARQVHQGPRPRGCRLDPRRLGYANKGYLCCPFFSLAARDLWVKRKP